MTREQVNQALLHLERLRMDSYEAENEYEERRLDREYGRIWKSIAPYVEGKIPYSDAT